MTGQREFAARRGGDLSGAAESIEKTERGLYFSQ